MHRPVGTGCSVIAFINSETPLLNLPIPRIPSLFDGVKKQVAHFCATKANERDDGIALQTRIKSWVFLMLRNSSQDTPEGKSRILNEERKLV